MIGEASPINPADGDARQWADISRRVAELERRRQRGIGGGRLAYEVFAWRSTELPSPVGISASAATILSFTQDCMVGDLVRMDASARVGGSPGAVGFVRLALSVVSPSAVLSDLIFSDSQPGIGSASGADQSVSVRSSAFSITATGTWTFALRSQTISASGTWVLNNNSTILRAEVISPTA